MIEFNLELNTNIAQDEAEELFKACEMVLVSGTTVFLRGCQHAVNLCIDIAVGAGLK